MPKRNRGAWVAEKDLERGDEVRGQLLGQEGAGHDLQAMAGEMEKLPLRKT